MAQSILGSGKPYDSDSLFLHRPVRTRHGVHRLFHHRQGYDEVVFRGARESGEYMVFWLRSGSVLAGMGVNVWDQMPAVAELIRQGLAQGPGVPRDALANVDMALGDLRVRA